MVALRPVANCRTLGPTDAESSSDTVAPAFFCDGIHGVIGRGRQVL